MIPGVGWQGAAGGFNPSLVSGMMYYWLSEDVVAAAGTDVAGTGTGTMTVASGVMTTSVATAGKYGTWLNGNQRAGCFITITGQPSIQNNGTFKLTSGGLDDGSQLAWSNAAGVTEAFVGTYRIWGSCNTLTERKASKVFNRTGVGDTTPGDCYLRIAPIGLSNGKRALVTTRASAAGNNNRLTLDDLTLASNFNGNVNWTMGGYYYMVDGWTSNTTNIGFQHVTATQAVTNVRSPTNRITLRQAGGGTTIDMNGGGQTDIMTSTTVPAASRGFQLMVWVYDAATRTTDFYVDGVLVQSVQDVVGTQPTPATLRYFHIGDDIQATAARSDVYCGGQFMIAGKMSAADQLQMKSFYDQALKPVYPDLNDTILAIPDLLTYINGDDAVTTVGGPCRTITDRVNINHIYFNNIGTAPSIELTQFPGHKVLTCTSATQIKCFFAALCQQLVGTDIPCSFFTYFKPTVGFNSSSNIICFENGASSPRIGMGNNSSGGAIFTRLGTPTANGTVNFAKSLNVWQSWCGVFNGTTVTFYKDKVSQGSVAVGTSLASTLNEVAVASNGFSGQNGDYYNWVAVKRALTQTEVNTIHDATVARLAA